MVLILGFAYFTFLGSRERQFTADERRLGLHCLDSDGYHPELIHDLEMRLGGASTIAPQSHDITAEEDGLHEITMFFATTGQDGVSRNGMTVASIRNDDCSHSLQVVMIE